MAQRIGAVAYVENSALTKEGVRNVSNKFRPSIRPQIVPRPTLTLIGTLS